MFDQFQQNTQAVGDSLLLSALCALIPLAVLFILLGGLKMRAWISGLAALAAAIVVAVGLFGMPAGQAFSAAVNGALFGFFPILWIVINAVWVYNLTVASGHFEVLRRSFEKVSPDQRIQAIIIAFCFGALLEALAGFGTPVAISVVMLMSLGFKPVKAATVALVANTAPVAFGALAIPIVTLAPIAAGVSDDPRLSDANALDSLGSMVGRQTPILALFVPLILVLIVDGRRGVRQAALPAMVAGTVFAVAQFVTANYLSVQLTDIVASLLSAGSVVLLVRVWQPVEVLTAERVEEEERIHAGASSESSRVGTGGGATTTTTTRGAGEQGSLGASPGTGAAAGTRRPSVDNRGDVIRAYAPYLVIIVIFSITNIPAVVDYLAKAPWTYLFDWPGLDILNSAGDPVATQFKFNWLPAAGTLLIIAGLITMVILKLSPAQGFKTYVETLVELRSAIITVMAVLGLAYVMNLSGQTTSLGVWLAGTGGAFALISPILGWIGVAVTGSDTSSNSLFGALQVQAAGKAGLDPVLMAAANSSGGVLGKMVSPQNLAIAAAAVGMSGNEGEIFRKVIGWSLLLLILMCAIVGLQATPVLSWMVP
jgi:lactate permease